MTVRAGATAKEVPVTVRAGARAKEVPGDGQGWG